MIEARKFQIAERAHYDEPGRALLWTMRAGKTKAAIDNAWYLFNARKIDAALVFAPLGVHGQWLEQLDKHAPDDYWVGGVWQCSAAGKLAPKLLAMRDRALHQPGLILPWFCFGKEQILTPAAFRFIVWVARKARCMLIVDESHHWRDPKARRWRSTVAISRFCPYVRLLSGTPDDNSPLNLFAQFEILKPRALGASTYREFQDQYAIIKPAWGRRGRIYQEVVGFKNREQLNRRVAALSSYVKEGDLRGLKLPTAVRRPFELTKAERVAYNKLREELLLEFDDGGLATAAAGGAALVKLQQVASGYVRDIELVDRPLVKTPGRLAALQDFAEEFGSGRSLVVWVKSAFEAAQVASVMPLAEVINGDVKLSKRRLIRDGFQAGRVLTLIAHPGCVGEGFNLSRAAALVWYGHTWDAALRRQAMARANEAGKEPPACVDLEAEDTVDKKILDCLALKRATANATHDILARELGRWLGASP